MTKDVGLSERALDRLAELQARDPDGLLTPEAVVADAEDKYSPLHRYLPWDDAVAGHQWRLHLARLVIGRAKIKSIIQQDTEITRVLPKYVNLVVKTSTGGTRRGYLEIEQAMQDEDLYLQALNDVITYLNGFKRRIAVYEGAREITPHLDVAIGAAEKQIQLTKEQNGNTSTD